jgi:thiol-disulfide isomerase/thioredoxin
VIQNHKFSGQIPDYFYTSDNPGYWINMYSNTVDPVGDAQCRKSDPFIVKDRDVPGFWPGRAIKDVITGKTIPYKDIVAKNKATVIYRWGSWCGFSAALLPQLRRMHEKYHAAGLEVIMRTAWGDPEGEKKLKDYILDNGYDVWYNFSSESENISFSEAAALGSGAMPFVNVIDGDGNVIFSSSGQVSDPSRNRFGHSAFLDLIPFLEDMFGPLDDGEVYSSTDYSEDGKVVTLQTASIGKGINIVFMGDAYTDRDMASSYGSLMWQAMEEFFSIEPYKTFRNRFNVYYVKAVSKNGKTGSGYTTALGTDASGTTISMSEASNAKCLEYASRIPGFNDGRNLLVCVLVNSSGVRGITSIKENLQSGIAYCASGSNQRDAFGALVRHEAGGHGFAFLADEYSTDTGSPEQALVNEYNRLYDKYGWYSNIDFTSDPAKVKWSAFLSDPRYKDEVGIYEGAGGPYSTGIYRPSHDSMMNHNVEYYNAPSRWAIYKRIMELSGETASFDKFLEYDAVNRKASE